MSEDEDDERTCLTCRHSFFPNPDYGWCMEEDGLPVCDFDACACWEAADGSGCGPRRWTFG